MIHSMSGGILADSQMYLFAKVEIGETPAWYLSPFSVSAGDRVLAPFGGALAEGTVLKAEYCTQQTAPVPLKRARALEKKL